MIFAGAADFRSRNSAFYTSAKGELSFAYAMGQLDARDRDGRALEGLEPWHRLAASPESRMVLLNDVIRAACVNPRQDKTERIDA